METGSFSGLLVMDRIPMAAAIAAVFVAVVLTRRFYATDLSGFPLMGAEIGNAEKRRQEYLKDPSQFYRKAYQSFKDKAFRLTANEGDDFIVVPLKYLDELAALPAGYLNSHKAVSRNIEPELTGLDEDPSLLIHLIKSELTRSMKRLSERMYGETLTSVPDAFGACKDWTATEIYGKIVYVVTIMTGNSYLGPELCRRDEWVHASINWTLDIFKGIGKVKQWRKSLRPFAKHFIPELNKIKEHRRAAYDFLMPVIRQRRALITNPEEKTKLPEDMLQWLVERAPEFGVKDDLLPLWVLGLSMASTHTTTQSTTDILMDLAVHPEVVRDLRAEHTHVLAANNGELGPAAFAQMKLLDSVMRESMRLRQGIYGNQSRFWRYVEREIVLSDGLRLPKGSWIETPHSPVVMDSALYPNPEKFDPYRFARLRSGEDPDPQGLRNKDLYQFANVTKENMMFGFGKDACPGRFFAANIIKMLVMSILTRYDLRMPGGKGERYESLVMGSQTVPNPMNELEFRAVQ